jgi:hypothetical protein
LLIRSRLPIRHARVSNMYVGKLTADVARALTLTWWCLGAHRMRMLKGTGSASDSADTQSGQVTRSEPQGAFAQPRDDLWKDVPGFGAAARQAPSEKVGQGSGSRSDRVVWQPRDPWRDEPVPTAAAFTESAGREPARAEDMTSGAIRGFNNDDATAAQVRLCAACSAC